MSTKDFLQIITERGFIHQTTDLEAISDLFDKEQVTAYIGFDCTAPTLHVGSLLQIMVLRWLQQCGHKPLILLGGGTTKIGDPSGKDKTRKMQTYQDICDNMDGIKNLFEKFIKFGNDSNQAILLNNDDWLSNINYVDFLRDIGKHFSINRMLCFDSVKLRLDREQNLSFLEFNYMILQAYDFIKLNQDYNCKLQIGGSDQWGNIVNGIELNRRLGNNEIYGLTTPLITTSSGSKMGKTEQGAVWLTENDFSAYDYWQFWRNTEDQDVGRFLKLFTELPLSEINKLELLKDAEINHAKIILANEATKLCHGEQAAKSSEETAKKTFEQGQLGEDLPTIEISEIELEKGVSTIKLFQQAGLVDSGGAAKRLIKGGGCKRNNEKIDNPQDITQAKHLDSNGTIKLSAGKKKHAIVKVIN